MTDNNLDLNFEIGAFIDFMIGCYREEVYGHSTSSFYTVLYRTKNTTTHNRL